MYCFRVMNMSILPFSVSTSIMVSPLGIFFRSASILESIFCFFVFFLFVFILVSPFC